ncbi:MAG TPA: tail fiber domain-containing protein [Chitinophaga sp.]
MKALLCAVAFVFLANYSFGQKVPQIYQIRADTVRIYNTCDTAEFVLENRTKDTLGFLFNKGKGRTEFRRLGLERIGASQLAIKGQDTIDLGFSSFGDTRYDLLSTNFVTIPSGDSLLFAQWPNMKVVGYDAYSSPDMPALSRQAIQGMGNKTYYNGLVVRDGNSGFDLAVNWDGELNGPNGAFLRTKDDTKQAWSKWRELLFKDYADTTYAPINTETLQSVISRGNVTTQDILFDGTPAPSAGLVWHFNTDFWRIFVESPQDTPGGDMIFESTDNDQEGWIFRSKNAATPKQVLNIQPEGTFTYLGNNILHTGNHPAGSGFATTGLTGPAVFSTIVTNGSGHITQLATRQLTAADIGAAPASTSGNYIQNLSTGTQTANFSISGTGSATTGFSSPLLFTNNSAGQLSLVGGAVATGTGNLRGAEIDLMGGSAATIPGEMSFRTGTGGSGAQQPERMRINAAGNVGIGTTNPASPLHVVGAATVTSMNGSGSATLQISSGGSAQATALMGGATSAQSNQGGAITLFGGAHGTQPGMITFYTGTAVGGTQQPERMRITAAGDVGIGTTAPAAMLDVNDPSTTANTTEAILSRFIGDLNFRLEARKGIATNTIGGVATKFGLTYNGTENALINFHRGPGSTGGFMSFTTNDGTEKMRIDAAGNVGIGTAGPTGKLEIANGTWAELQFSGANVANIYQAASAQALYVNSNTGPVYLGANGSGSTHLTVLSSGNVGIGATAPGAKLEVAGAALLTGGGNITLKGASTDAGDVVFTDGSNVEYARVYTASGGGSLHFSVGSAPSPKLTVTSAGNVGIGITAPTSPLHVAGAGLFTGQVQANSFFQYSLRSLKKDIKPFTASALDIFKKVQVRTFIFKADTTGKTNIGFIADEVPDEMATPKRNGVDQASTVALLVKAVQELTEQNKVLQEKISKLEAKMKEK